MLTLDLPTETYWLDLPRGVRVEIRPVTTAVMAAAQAAAQRRLRADMAGVDLDIAGAVALAREMGATGWAAAELLAAMRAGMVAGQARWLWLRSVSPEGNVSALAGPVTATAL